MNSVLHCIAILACLCVQPAVGESRLESAWLDQIKLEFPKSCAVRLLRVDETVSGNNGLRIEHWSVQTCQGPIEYSVSYYPQTAFPARKSEFEVQQLSNGATMRPSIARDGVRRLTVAARNECTAKGGRVERILVGAEGCVVPTSGKACTDKSDCQGTCNAPSGSPSDMAVVGSCAADTGRLGCLNVVVKGKASGEACFD